MESLMIQRLAIIAEQIESATLLAIDHCKDLINFEEAEITQKKLETSINRFTSDLHNYFRLSVEPSADDISSFSEIQLKGEEVLAELNVRLTKRKERRLEDTLSEAGSGSRALAPTIQSSKLPKLNLATYDGNILEWYQFWDQFHSNIECRNITDVDKLLYLKSSLTGNAKLAIEGLEVTNKNYEIAVKTLKERFGKESHIIDAHYSALYRTKGAEKTPEDARRTLNEVERHLRVLSSLGEDINHNHLRFLITEKFPEDIIYEMKMMIKAESIEEMRRCLEIIISAREDANRIVQAQDNKAETFTTENLHIKDAKPLKQNFSNKAKTIQNNNRNFQQRNLNVIKKPQHKGPLGNMPNREPLKRPHEKSSWNNENGPNQKRGKPSCVFCRDPHYSDMCQRVKTMKERREKLRDRCFGCFSKDHRINQCKNMRPCAHCHLEGAHHRALCPKLFIAKKETTKLFHANTMNSTVLQTAIVNVKCEGSSDVIKCRILLDSGSQRTYVTQDLAKKLNLDVEEECRLSVFTFGSSKPQEFESAIVKLQIQSRTNNAVLLFANVVPTISDGIAYPDGVLKEWKEKAILADDGSLSSRIDILIGNDYYFSLMSTGKIKLSEYLFLVESKLGWILSGKVDSKLSDELSAVTYFQSAERKLVKPDLPLNNGSIKCLWELESIGICDSPKADRDEEAIKYFNDTTEVVDNRYTVSWPWNEYPPNLPSNFGLAFGRLVNLLKRLSPDNLHSYNETLQEQLKLGIIEVIPQVKGKFNTNSRPIHYLPHHGVCCPGKPTRIVYDASAKTKDNKSLNECLQCGPMMLENLTEIFLRFRYHQVGITADVEKAFLQLALQEKDKDVTRFLWLKDITKPASQDNLLHLRFCRVPFGIISSPFLLNATIKYHLSHHNEESLKQIANDIYVDNLVTSTKSSQEAIALYKASKKAFQDISMNIREWSSNSKKVMDNIPVPDTCKDDLVKVLGYIWDTQTDTIKLRFKEIVEANTKREVLRVIASIYDPCGYAVPHILPAKLFLQELWKCKEIKWVTTLPEEMMSKWWNITKELQDIQTIMLPRCYFKNNNDGDIYLHCFVDASMQAYSAVVYLSNSKGEIAFVIGKSRLVPVKDQDKLKIPRLELLGAVIGSRLVSYVAKSIHIKFTNQIIWTDSQIVIDWYNSTKLLTPFVARRIEEIRRNTNLILKKVPTELNPADVATRPNRTREDKQRWLAGPSFLSANPKFWPSYCRNDNSFLCGEGLTNEDKSESGNSKDMHQQTSQQPMAREVLGQDTLTAAELQKITEIQKDYFPEETSGQETNISRNLGLFLDENGLIRCRGRMKNANWPFDKKYPILIPKNCDYTNNKIISIHEENFHVGVNHTLSLIRQNYWIPQGRSYVQKILRKCAKCVKQEGGPFKLPPTPALPQERVNYSTPFTFTGVDYFGPINVQTDRRIEKRWVCLYTCLAVRAISLETVKDLTAQECLLALRRFIAVRGVPSVIVSDNALQFKLSAEVLSDNYCIRNKIAWKFIPQLSPWHGGFYERLVGIVKNCLRRSLTKQLLSESHLVTIIKEIEAVVNTRPLTSVGSDIEDVLRPADFLTLGKCITTEPSDHFQCHGNSVTKQNLIDSWKRGQILLNEFRSMFENQYLPSLRERYQHSHKQHRVTTSRQPKIGDIVQLKGDSKNRENWRVGKIVSLPVGADGLCRVARIRVGSTEFTRSIGHLYPLELENDLPAMKLKSNEERKRNVVLPMSLRDTKSTEQRSAESTAATDSRIAQTTEDLAQVENEIVRTNNDIAQTDDAAQADVDMLPVQRDTIQNDIPAICDNNPDEMSNESKGTRVAAQRAREKIRLWTSQLMTLF